MSPVVVRLVAAVASVPGRSDHLLAMAEMSLEEEEWPATVVCALGAIPLSGRLDQSLPHSLLLELRAELPNAPVTANQEQTIRNAINQMLAEQNPRRKRIHLARP